MGTRANPGDVRHVERDLELASVSWKHVNMVLLTRRPRWKNATQQALLTAWAQLYREDWGYAIWSYRKLNARLGLKRARLNRVTRELEALGVGGRIPDGMGCGNENRYFVVPEAFEDRRYRDVGPPVIAGVKRERRGEAPLVVPKQPRERTLFDVNEEREGAILQDQGADPPVSGGPDTPGSGGLILQDQEKYTVPDSSTPDTVVHGTRTAAADEQPRLDSLLQEVRQKKNRHLSTDPADDGNFRAVCRAVRDVVSDPTIGARLLKGYEPARESDVCEAVRRLCDRRHILTGRHPNVKRDVIRDAVEFERVKLSILGGAPRPRELEAQRRRRR
jgi:hypothetical protein